MHLEIDKGVKRLAGLLSLLQLTSDAFVPSSICRQKKKKKASPLVFPFPLSNPRGIDRFRGNIFYKKIVARWCNYPWEAMMFFYHFPSSVTPLCV